MKINAGDLVNEIDGVKLVEEKIVQHGRWNVYMEYIYKIRGDYYRFSRSVGATEMQDDDSWSERFVGWKDVEGIPVKKVEKIVEVWVDV